MSSEYMLNKRSVVLHQRSAIPELSWAFEVLCYYGYYIIFK